MILLLVLLAGSVDRAAAEDAIRGPRGCRLSLRASQPRRRLPVAGAHLRLSCLSDGFGPPIQYLARGRVKRIHADPQLHCGPDVETSRQMAKVGRALLDGDTGDQVESVAANGTALAGSKDSAAAANAAVTGGVGGQQAVRPQFFKALAGKGHQEFSSGRQQVGTRLPVVASGMRTKAR